ncbi:MAG: DNA-binding protein AraC-type, partial [Mycobacterium sp.]|nr:DNA-binding protein AraC-type [Mycobacterium sp.]
MFDLDRWAPSDDAAEFLDHFWSVSWDLREREPFASTVITFPSMHLTHEWGSDKARHGHSLPATLIHGVVERVFTTTISERGTVVGARFRPGGFAARLGRDAASFTGRVDRVDDELLGGRMDLDDDVAGASSRMDEAIAAGTGEPDQTYRALTALIERIRDDDHLHRVEQVMAHSPWSARTTQRVFR